MLRLVKEAESIPAGVWCGGSGLLFCLLPPRQSALKESTEAEENDAIDFCLAARSTWFAGHTEAARSWRAGPKEEQTHRQRDAFHRAETYRSAFIIREYFIFCSASLQRRISSFEITRRHFVEFHYIRQRCNSFKLTSASFNEIFIQKRFLCKFIKIFISKWRRIFLNFN